MKLLEDYEANCHDTENHLVSRKQSVAFPPLFVFMVHKGENSKAKLLLEGLIACFDENHAIHVCCTSRVPRVPRILQTVV